MNQGLNPMQHLHLKLVQISSVVDHLTLQNLLHHNCLHLHSLKHQMHHLHSHEDNSISNNNNCSNCNNNEQSVHLGKHLEQIQLIEPVKVTIMIHPPVNQFMVQPVIHVVKEKQHHLKQSVLVVKLKVPLVMKVT